MTIPHVAYSVYCVVAGSICVSLESPHLFIVYSGKSKPFERPGMAGTKGQQNFLLSLLWFPVLVFSCVLAAVVGEWASC